MIAIDPGRRALGWAWFEHCELRGLGLVRGKAGEGAVELAQRAAGLIRAETGLEAHHVVYERMQVYAGQRQKGDQNDLIELAEIGGGMAALLASTSTPLRPREWKGQVPKDVLEGRVRKRLSEQELALTEARLEAYPASLRHNGWDAVGIGLWACGRLA